MIEHTGCEHDYRQSQRSRVTFESRQAETSCYPVDPKPIQEGLTHSGNINVRCMRLRGYGRTSPAQGSSSSDPFPHASTTSCWTASQWLPPRRIFSTCQLHLTGKLLPSSSTSTLNLPPKTCLDNTTLFNWVHRCCRSEGEPHQQSDRSPFTLTHKKPGECIKGRELAEFLSRRNCHWAMKFKWLEQSLSLRARSGLDDKFENNLSPPSSMCAMHSTNASNV